MIDRHRIGILSSTTGPYGLVGRAMQNGAILAVKEVNAGDLGIALEPDVVDPKVEIAGYATGADRLRMPASGTSPNQHIVPLVQHLLAHGGRTAFCIGSNYIWAWENNRILPEAPAPVAPDPYLMRSAPRIVPVLRRPRLRVVPS